MIKLRVNIDHIATIRQARKEGFPSLVEAAAVCERAGADGITIHLRQVKIGVITLLTAFVLFGFTFSSCKRCKKDNPEPEDKTIATDIEPAPDPAPAPAPAPAPDNPPNNTLNQAEKIKAEKIKTLIKDKVIVSLQTIYANTFGLHAAVATMPGNTVEAENVDKWAWNALETIHIFFGKVASCPTMVSRGWGKYGGGDRKVYGMVKFKVKPFDIDIKNDDLDSLKINLDAIIAMYKKRDVNWINIKYGCEEDFAPVLDRNLNDLIQHQAEWDEMR
jgi:hypothetical protein